MDPDELAMALIVSNGETASGLWWRMGSHYIRVSGGHAASVRPAYTLDGGMARRIMCVDGCAVAVLPYSIDEAKALLEEFVDA